MARWSVLTISTTLLLLASGLCKAQTIASSDDPDQNANLSVPSVKKLPAGRVLSSVKPSILVPKQGYGNHASNAATSNSSHNGGGGGGWNSDSSYYTTDVSNPLDGPVIDHASQHALYVNTNPRTVGKPSQMLKDLEKSRYIHVVDQYVGQYDDDRYKAKSGAQVIYINGSIGAPLFDDPDIWNIVYVAASSFGESGRHVIYHVFTGPGQDVCFGNPLSPTCYSPDNPQTFDFCGYHSTVTFSDIGEVQYTVIPFTAVAGCEVGSPSPNGLTVDSTMSVLAHELAETITDPEGTSWLNYSGLILYGSEIADICQNPTFVYPVVALNGTQYELQALYSNEHHNCSYTP